MAHKVYGVFGTLLCIFFFFASQTGFRIFDLETTGHTGPAATGPHHK